MQYWNFESLFFLREGKSLLGPLVFRIFPRNLTILCVILFCAFSSIAFAFGGLQYLSEKMKDPFINYYPMAYNVNLSASFNDIKNNLSNKDILDHYNISYVTTYYASQLKVKLKQDSKRSPMVKIRSIDSNGQLLQSLLENENLINKFSNSSFENEQDVSIIVTEKLFLDLQTTMDSYLNHEPPKSLTHLGFIPIPIKAVVKNLPDNADILLTNNTFRRMQRPKDGVMRYPYNPLISRSNHNDYNLQLVSNSKLNEQLLKKFFVKENIEVLNIETREITNLISNHYLYNIGFNELDINIDEISKIYETLKQNSAESENFERIYQFDDFTFNKDSDPHNIAFIVNDLNKIELLRDYLINTFNLPIDLSKIQKAKNFRYMRSLTFALSIILILLSLISTLLYIYNILSTHLNSVKLNIGSLAAFGLEEKNYTLLSTLLIISSIVIAFFLSVSICTFLISPTINNYINDPISKFNFIHLNYWLFFLIIFVLVLGSLITYIICSKTLRKSPGELIYG